MSKQSNFIAEVVSGAQEGMQKYGILASLTMSQGADESGWAKDAPGYNMFGIKANGWSGKTQLLTTKEQKSDGTYVTVKALFRAYDSLSASIEDHGAFLSGISRYKNLIGCRDYKTACERIRTDGYATELSYSTDLINLIEENNLAKYDTLPTELTIDAVHCAKGVLTISGWALVMNGLLHVDLYCDGKDAKHGITNTRIFVNRSDVNAARNKFGWFADGAKCGWNIITSRIPKGRHTLYIAAVGKDNSVTWQSANVTMV
jgi:hypothetical protein